MEERNNPKAIGRAVIVWGAADLYFIVSVMTAVLFGILSPELQKHLNLTTAEVGLLGSVFFLSYGLAQLVTGSLIDYLGPRFTLTGSAIIAAAGLYLLSIADSLTVAIGAKLLVGIGLSSSYIGALYLAGTWFPKERFPLVSGVTEMSANIFTATLVLIMALSGGLVSYGLVMGTLGSVVLALGVLIFIFVRSAPDEVRQPENSGRESGFLSDVHTLVSIPQFWLGAIYFSTAFAVYLAFADLWNIPDQMAYGNSLESAAIMNAMLPLGGAFGAVLAGWIADYLDRRSTVAKVYIIAMTLVSAALIYGPKLPVSAAFFLLFVLGFFFGGAVLGFPLVAQHIPPVLKGRAFGLMAMIAYLLSALLQYVMGVLLGQQPAPGTPEAIHDFKLAMTPLMITIVIGLICSRWLRDPEKEPTK